MNEDFVPRKGYDRSTDVSVPAGSTGTVIYTEQVPIGTHLKLTHLANIIAVIDGYGYITWSVRINDVPHRSYGEFTNQYGDMAHMHEMGDQIIAGPGDVVTVVCKNSDGANAYECGFGFRGAWGSPRRR